MPRQQLGVSGGKATTPSICRHGTTADGISDAQESPVLRLIFEKAYQSKHNASISVTTQLTLTAHRKNIKSKSAHQKDGNPIILTYLPDPGSPHCLSSTLAHPPYLERIFVTTKRTKEGTSGYSTSHCDVDNPGYSQYQVPTSVSTSAPTPTPTTAHRLTPTPTPGY